MRDRTRWTAVLFLLVGTHGVISQTRGPLLASFEASFGVSPGLLGLVVPAASIGLLLAVVLLGMNAGRIGVRRGLLLGVGFAITSLLLLTVVQSYWVLVLLFLVQGVGFGTVRALDRPLLGHLYADSRGRVFNLYALTWAVGATVGPLFVNAVLSTMEWRLTFLLLVVPLVPVVVVLWRTSPPREMHREESLSVPDIRRLLGRPAVLGMAGTLVLSGAIEGTMLGWFAYYAGGFVPRPRANLLLSGFLVMYVPGRLLYSYLCDHLPPLDLVLGLAVLGIPAAVVTFTTRSSLGLAVGSLAFGFVVSGLFPTLSAFGVDTVPEHSGPVNAIATGANFTGFSVAPLVVGLVSEWTDIASGMLLLVPLMVGVAVMTALTRRRVEPRSRAMADT